MARALAVLLLVPGLARAEPVSPRAVGRAGAAVVADDGAAAVIVNPAALARREARRAQVGGVVVDDDARHDARAGGPEVEDSGASAVAPLVGGAARLGPVVVGVGLVDEEVLARRFAEVEAGQPPGFVEDVFPHRYAGLAMSLRRRTVGVGAAWRATEWLAIGGALTASRVTLAESRHLWGGFTGRLDRVGDPQMDVLVRVDGADAFVPGFAAGALVAPIDVPIELAVSVRGSAAAELAGGATAEDVQPASSPSVSRDGPRASAELAAPLVVRSGVRWLGARWIAELGGDLVYHPRDADPTWSIDGLAIVDDLTGRTAPVDALPSRLARRAHGTLRAAVDVEVVPGFLWLTGGVARTTAATPRARLTAAAGAPGGTTGALGLEVSTSGLTLTVGVARTFARTTDVSMPAVSIDNPFAAGTAPTGAGRVSHARDLIAATVELELQ